MIANIPFAQSGIKGPLAAAIQAALCEAGHAIDIDGEFGPNTENALREYQKKNGLDVDGIAGPATYAKLLGGYTSNE